MKTYFLFLYFIFVATFTLKAQTSQFYPIEKLALISPTNKSKGILLGEDIQKAIQAFGQPSSVKEFYYEMDEKMAYLYTFMGNKFYVLDGKLDAYEITNSSILVGKINGTTFKVGDKLKSTKKKVLKGPPGPGETFVWKETFSFLDFILKAEKGIAYNYGHAYYSSFGLTYKSVVFDGIGALLFDSNKQLFFIVAGPY